MLITGLIFWAVFYLHLELQNTTVQHFRPFFIRENLFCLGRLNETDCSNNDQVIRGNVNIIHKTDIEVSIAEDEIQ